MLGMLLGFGTVFWRLCFEDLKNRIKKPISLEQTRKEVEQSCMTFPQSPITDVRWDFLFVSLGAFLYT